jgi:2-polyprenyl-3-methyl-5-hydroxy-6-metoxy-1,4-benzoquinol methylase
MSSYSFDNAWQQAHRRLSLLAECLDPATQRRMQALGIGPGWQCLDVGAGGGSIAQWLATQVKPGGKVLATDLDTRFLTELPETNLEVRRHDITSDALPEAAFDLVHTRLVLMHVSAREQVLPRLVSALKPGGWLLLEEHDAFPIDATASGAYARVWGAMIRAVTSAGAVSHWGRELPNLLARHRLEEISAEVDVPLFPGASPLAEFWRLSISQVREGLGGVGASGADVDESLALLADPSRWFMAPALVAVRGRRPASA